MQYEAFYFTFRRDAEGRERAREHYELIEASGVTDATGKFWQRHTGHDVQLEHVVLAEMYEDEASS